VVLVPAKKKRQWLTFGRYGVIRAVDPEKVSHIELSSLPVAGELNPSERLHLFFGDSHSPLTVVEPDDIETLLGALDLEEWGGIG
jgi:hypothetical protein